VTVDPQVLAALEASVSALPIDAIASVPVRVHLAGLYLADGQPQAALDHATKALETSPHDMSALSVAGSAAHALGQDAVAESFRHRQEALLAGSDEPAPRETDVTVQAAATRSPAPVGPAEGWPEDDTHLVTLADVAGMSDVKRRLQRSLLAPMANETLREAFRKRLRGGLLLWGAPGTGKTFIARALSGELGAAFVSASPADIYNEYFGASEGNVARLFAQARRSAPCVVFLDEIDALGGRRSQRHTDQARGVVNQLLVELDGMKSNEGLFVLAATNAPWDVDDALRRPGRFDRTVLVLPPDAPARDALLSANLAGRPVVPEIDLSRLVRAAETYSGADLARLVEAATERALDRSVDLGVVSPITAADLDAALADTPSSTRQWLMTAATYVAHSIDGEDYRELRAYLRTHRIS
jgi:AAA+ superfamily predicted ATPase